MSEFEHKDAVVKSINAIKNGPRAMQLYMDICAKCGTCAENCHVYYADPRKETNPAARSDLIRNLYKKHNTITGKLLRKGELTEADFEGWVRSFYECSGCRRCAVFCPYGIDNSVLTRKGRAIIHSLGMSPVRIADTQDISDKFGNDEAQPPKAIRAALEFLEEEIEDETGVKVSIPVDQEADIVFVPASADLISFPETQMGVAYFFHLIGASWTMATDAVDGANFGLFSGDDAHMKRKNKLLHDACLKYKAKMLIIGECGHAYRIAKRIGGANYWGDNGKLPYEITNIFSFAAPYFKDGTIKLDKTRFGKSVTYHDPCNFGRSTGVTEEPRDILNLLVDDFREMTPNRAHNWCCGGGGGLAVMDGKEGVKAFGDDMTFLDSRMKSAKKKVEQVRATGAEYMAAPCANCKRHVGQMLEHYETGVESGGVFDILLKAAIPPQ